MEVNAYLYREGLVYGRDVGAHAEGRKIETVQDHGNKKRKYLYVVEPKYVFPTAFKIKNRETHHSDIALADMKNYKGYKNVIEFTEEWGNGDGKWYADERPGFHKTVVVTYVEDDVVRAVREDRLEVPRKKLQTDWCDDVHATEEKDLSNAQFVKAIQAFVAKPERQTYLVLDSAAGGSTKALTAAFGTGIRVIVPNPEGFKLENAEVDAVSLLEYFQTRKAEALAACYFDLTCMPKNAAPHLTEMIHQGSMFEGQIIAVTVSNRRRSAEFKQKAIKAFQTAVEPYFSLELLQSRVYARMAFFIFQVYK